MRLWILVQCEGNKNLCTDPPLKIFLLIVITICYFYCRRISHVNTKTLRTGSSLAQQEFNWSFQGTKNIFMWPKKTKMQEEKNSFQRAHLLVDRSFEFLSTQFLVCLLWDPVAPTSQCKPPHRRHFCDYITFSRGTTRTGLWRDGLFQGTGSRHLPGVAANCVRRSLKLASA